MSFTRVSFPSFNLEVVGNLYTPESSATSRNGAAIVIAHPMTGVKEQTASDYARVLSAAGFYALVYDAAYQGESSGLPRGLEDPHQRIEDIKAAVTFLSTRVPAIDPQRIGVVGICASGGYSSYAAQSDSRIRALATVSAACVGHMTRHGGVHKGQSESAMAVADALKIAGQWRVDHPVAEKDAEEAPKIFDACNLPEDADAFFKDGSQYYGTKRGLHERCTQRVPPSSYDLMVSYDSFAFQRLIAPRPLLMVAGENAHTLHYSEDAVANAQGDKELFVVKGKNHFDLYDDLSESGPKIVGFFVKDL
ncbi:hypothetical protein TD95_000861 [Thielaviopsis punctulata]|uniref:Dienelactone hydrolase domain-containing protein n=1 Tax=Thielaviopsis punctulata TaxID=72032 RepID=A0A0F4Z8T3_9PEZI|nr:hypothetical protein TD95_000861 [Thielaviopsis punctulata]